MIWFYWLTEWLFSEGCLSPRCLWKRVLPANPSLRPLDFAGNRAVLLAILFHGSGENCPQLGGEWCRSHLPLQQVLRVQECFSATCRRAWKSEGSLQYHQGEGKENPVFVRRTRREQTLLHAGICPCDQKHFSVL